MRRRAALLALCLTLLFLCAPGAFAAGGAVQAEASPEVRSYLEESPIQLEDFLRAPMEALRTLLQVPLRALWKKVFAQYVRVLFLLLCGAALVIAMPEEKWQPMLGTITACGCFLLLSDNLVSLTQTVADRAFTWRNYLVGFIPVFSGLMLSGGQPAGAGVYNGLFLMGVCGIAELIRRFLLPMISGFLALSAASVFSTSDALTHACRALGRLLHRILAAAGACFAALLGVQRAFAASADAAAGKAGWAAVTGAVPIVGSAVTSAANAILAGLHLLQTGLGFAAIAFLAADFLPLYSEVMLHCLLLEAGGTAARLLELSPCEDLMRCLAGFMEVVGAVLALFFGMIAFSTVWMLVLTGGAG